MKVERVELRRVRLPLVTPFRTSFGTQTERDALLVWVTTPDAEGWGECVALAEPSYSTEYVDGAHDVMRRFLAPAVLAGEGVSWVHGHPMAKAAIEMALLDAELRAAGRSFGERLGAVRGAVDCGVSVSIADSVPALLDTVAAYLDDGYRRVKLKIEPGWDVEPVRAVRERFGEELLLQVDANCAYTLADADQLARLDPYGLLLIEQPLAEWDVAGHAELAKLVRTPICLDETIASAASAEACIDAGACAVVNIKAGRVGGYLEAVRVHDVCLAAGVPVWCGGMLETGLGRAANLALAALPGFTLPGDTSASDRYYARDITDPFVLHNGQLDVPTGPGLGVTPRADVLEDVTTAVEELSRRG